jgi:hypothetical protein
VYCVYVLCVVELWLHVQCVLHVGTPMVALMGSYGSSPSGNSFCIPLDSIPLLIQFPVLYLSSLFYSLFESSYSTFMLLLLLLYC